MQTSHSSLTLTSSPRVGRGRLGLLIFGMPFRKPTFAPPPMPDSEDDDDDAVAVKVGETEEEDDWKTSTKAVAIRKAQGGDGSVAMTDIKYDDLETLKQLGKGMSSKVYLKKHKRTGQIMAVKELSAGIPDDARAMAINELKIAHKHARQEYLVNFIGGFVHEGKICICLEFCGAGDLEGVIKLSRAKGGLPPAPLGAMTLQYLNGLNYLHREMKQVHRDLKPANIMLTDKGVCKLSDFGISKQLDETGAVANTQVGTTLYFAPERMRGDPYSFPSDVWAVGVITLEALAGTHPYAGIKGGYMSVMAAVCNQPSPPPPEGSPPEVIDFVAATLRKDASNGRAGRPKVGQLINHAWLTPHTEAASVTTLSFLRELGVVKATADAKGADAATAAIATLSLAGVPPTAP